MNKIGNDIDIAAELLKLGEVVAIPTETVYGLAANANNKKSVEKIFELKNRPASNPLILHFSAIAEISAYVEHMPEVAIQLAQKFWPGPLTMLLPRSSKVLETITAGSDFVAVRIPQHPLTLALLKKIQFPLAAPSANLTGKISPTEPIHVYNQLGEKLPYILDGGICEKGIESTIVGFKNDEVIIYRHGVITAKDIFDVVKTEVYSSTEIDKTITPGMSISHYAPKTKFFLFDSVDEIPVNLITEKTGLISFNQIHAELQLSNQRVLSHCSDLNEAASNLYKSLYELDALGLQLIVGIKVPNVGVGIAINDRMIRASS